MIVSASRRTDIPAFYSDWFMKRIKEGYCFVKNPVNPKSVRRVSLKRGDVDAFVFWSKNPRPMFKNLGLLDEEGYKYIFLYTLNDYPKWLEPNMPNVSERVETFINISERIGKERVSWRYDPIVLTKETFADFHIERFGYLFDKLSDYTTKIIISFFKSYRFVINRMKRSLKENQQVLDYEKNMSEVRRLASELGEFAKSKGIEIVSCAEVLDLNDTGILPGACIDGKYLEKIFRREFNTKKDTGQRKECRCSVSVDIGAYDTCVNKCVYCYASRRFNLSKKRYKEHNPEFNSITGWVDEGKISTKQKSPQTKINF